MIRASLPVCGFILSTLAIGTPGQSATLPEIPWQFPPPRAEQPSASSEPVSFRHLPVQQPKRLWHFISSVDLTDPEAVAAGAQPPAPQPARRGSESPLDRPAWAVGPYVGPLFEQMRTDGPEFLDKISRLIKDARREKDEPLANTLSALRALACLRHQQTATAKGVFTQLRKSADPQLRAFALAYGEVLRRHSDGMVEGKNLADWIVFRSAGVAVAQEISPKLRRKIAASENMAKGSILVLRKAAENVDRLKDRVRMLGVLHPGAADAMIPHVLQREHDVRLACLDMQIQTAMKAREKVIEAAKAIRPRVSYNAAARRWLDEIGSAIDFVPAPRVVQHNDLLRVFGQQWARALEALRSFDTFLVATEETLPRPLSEAKRTERAVTLWSAPFVDDLAAHLKDYYYDKTRPTGRVFYELVPSTKPQRVRSR